MNAIQLRMAISRTSIGNVFSHVRRSCLYDEFHPQSLDCSSLFQILFIHFIHFAPQNLRLLRPLPSFQEPCPCPRCTGYSTSITWSSEQRSFLLHRTAPEPSLREQSNDIRLAKNGARANEQLAVFVCVDGVCGL